MSSSALYPEYFPHYVINAINGCSGGNITLYGFGFPGDKTLPDSKHPAPVLHGGTPLVAQNLLNTSTDAIRMFMISNDLDIEGYAFYLMPNGDLLQIYWVIKDGNYGADPTKGSVTLSFRNSSSAYDIWYYDGSQYTNEEVHWFKGNDTGYWYTDIWIAETGSTPPSKQ